MNKFLAGTIAVIALGVTVTVTVTVPACAADMAAYYTRAPMAAPVMTYNWTGCYIGGNVGSGRARTDQSRVSDVTGVPARADFGSSEGSNVIGGAQIGCDYQFSPKWVVGVQGMFDFGNVDSRHVIPTAFPGAPIGAFSSQTRTKDIFTFTGRVGYLFVPSVLGYVKGGGAWTQTDHAVFGSIPVPFRSETANNDRAGWTLGGGLEWMFLRGWSVFGEYNYTNFGRNDVAFTAAPGTVGAADVVSTRLIVQQAAAGVNYKFNWGGPVVAKY
jgi:outer membrane immunogenic protein